MADYTNEQIMQEIQRRKGSASASTNKGSTPSKGFGGNYKTEKPTLKGVAQSPGVQGILGFGDALVNTMRKPISNLTGSEFKPTKFGEGGAYETGKFAGEIAPWLAINPASALARVGIGTAGGALLGDDLGSGAKEGLAWSAGMEAIPVLGKMLKTVPESFFREGFSQQLMDKMTKDFTGKKEKAMGYLNPLLNKFGDNTLTGNQKESLMKSFGENSEYLGPDVKKKFNSFMQKPKIKDAQDLQSILGEEIRGLDPSQVANKDRINASNNFRDSVLDSMYDRFDQLDTKGTADHKEFRKIWAKDVKPYESNPTLSKVVHNERFGMTPKKLEEGLMRSTQGDFTKIPKDNPIHGFSKEMNDKMNLSRFYGKAGSAATGAAAMAGGAAAMAGPAGMLGVAATPFITGAASKTGQLMLDKTLQDLLTKAYPPVRQAGVGLALAPEEQ